MFHQQGLAHKHFAHLQQKLQDCFHGCVCVHPGATTRVSKKQKIALGLGTATPPLCCFSSDLSATTSPSEPCARNLRAAKSRPTPITDCISKAVHHPQDILQSPGLCKNGHLPQSEAVHGSPRAARHRPWYGRASASSRQGEMPSGHSTALVVHHSAAKPLQGRAVAHSPSPCAGDALALMANAASQAAWLREEADVAEILPHLVHQAEAYNVSPSSHAICTDLTYVCIAIKQHDL